MPFDGTGNFIPLDLPDFPAIGGEPIYADQFNNVINDLIGGFASVLARDGQSSMTGNLSLGGFKIQQLGSASANGQGLAWGQTGAVLRGLDLGTVLGSQKLQLWVDPAATGLTGIVGVNPSDVNATFDTTKTVSQYGLTWKNLSWTGAGPVGILSGYGGLSFVTGGVESWRLMTGGQLTNMGLEDVNAQLSIRGNTTSGARVVLSSELQSGATHQFGSILFDGWRDVASPSYIAGMWAEGASAVGNNADLVFGAMANGGTGLPTERLRIASGGAATFTGNVTAPQFFGTFHGAADSVNWTGVFGRPTRLTDFINDLPSGPSGVTTFNGRGGAVSLLSADVTGALGYTPLSGINSAMVTGALGFTPYSNANPAGYITSAGSCNFASAAGSIPWANVTSRPTSLGDFSNGPGYVNAVNVTHTGDPTGLVWQVRASVSGGTLSIIADRTVAGASGGG